MPSTRSAGVLPFRRPMAGELQVFLVHPGGPFWRNKDARAWSIAKGEVLPNEDLLAAARREFLEETGFAIDGHFVALKPVVQRGGKTVYAFAIEADFDASQVRSNTFAIEWPPKSGKMQNFPEIDRAAWFNLETALVKIHAGQLPLLLQLQESTAGF